MVLQVFSLELYSSFNHSCSSTSQAFAKSLSFFHTLQFCSGYKGEFMLRHKKLNFAPEK
jgi:hypothetical protein